ncbi:hypothetical protein ACJMK2_043446 [Sinanodonta woodiana]|uniref:Importin-11 n=1 Tax=Sinanodonta woodiana TaxID=1069815 RepID=A0ABD3VWX2_SINWO
MNFDNAGSLVLETLTKACSQSVDVLKPAEQQLQQWETQPGFYTVLCTISSDHNIDVSIRWLAVLYCKNGVDRYWRKSAPHAISELEKEGIRKELISNFNEPASQVATQLAVLVGKIARLDCPRAWPDLLPTLLQAVRCTNPLSQERVLLVLHHVIKTLASKRLAPDRKIFEDLTNEIFSYIFGLWRNHLEEFLQLASTHNDAMMLALDRTILSLKILRRLASYGFRELTDSSDAMSFISMVFNKLHAALDCRRSFWGNHHMVEKCEKLIVLMTKVLLDILELQPQTYIQFIQNTLEFVVTYNFTQTGLSFERFTVNCFNLLKNILHCDMYRPTKGDSPGDGTETSRMSAYKIKADFFTFDMLSEICRRLVLQYFLLTSDDLSIWDTDPEQFCQEEAGDSFKFSLRPCTETLFLSLFKEYRLSLTPVLLDMVKTTQEPCDPNNMVELLQKDAVYHAVGLAAFDLFDEVNFDQWFLSHLLTELQMKHENYRIVHRRVIWLAGQWVGVKMSMALRPSLYQAILPLLSSDEDLVVRLEAANTLKLDILFIFYYLNVFFSLLFQLLKEVHECDTKMQILHVISFVIERVGAQIRPYASSLISYLPSLWAESGDHNMLRCAILTTLIHLVQGFGVACTSIYEFLLPVIQISTDVCQPQYVYLMEDGLELWHVTLMNSPTVTQPLLNIFKNMSSLLELGTENLRICLKIIEAYLLLGPREFMEMYSSDLVRSLAGLLTDLRTEGVVLVLKVIELVFKAFPKEGPEVFRSVLPSFFQAVLDKDEHPVVNSLYLAIFGRVMLQNQEFIWKLLEEMSLQLGKDMQTLLKLLISAWVDSLDSMTQPERRKLSALALASLLTINSSAVCEMFASIINLCVQVLHDVCRVPVDEDPTIQIDALVISDGDDVGEDEQEVEHEKRKRLMTRQDPVHSLPLKDCFLARLEICRQMHGQANFDQLMGTVDQEILNQLHQFVRRY